MPKALIVEDNRLMADNLCLMLEFIGLEVEVAYGPRTGMLNVTKIPDIVFLDISMPGIDGFEVLAFIRRQPTLDNTPVVFVTSDDQKETAKKAKDSGVLNLMVKPVTIEMLEKVLKQHNII